MHWFLDHGGCVPWYLSPWQRQQRRTRKVMDEFILKITVIKRWVEIELQASQQQMTFMNCERKVHNKLAKVSRPNSPWRTKQDCQENKRSNISKRYRGVAPF
jgi:hypothetical protein